MCGKFFTREHHFALGILDCFWQYNIPPFSQDVILPKTVANPLSKVIFPANKFTTLANPQNQ